MLLAVQTRMSVNGWMRANPFKTSVVVTTVKAGAADIMVQRCVEGASEVDEQRLVTFLVFGCAYQGCFQYWMFNCWFERWLPGRALRPTIQKILAANALADPVFFFPCFYTLKEALLRRPEERFRLDTIRTALHNYYVNSFEDLRNTWSVWLPGHAVTYGICPIHLRMPWIAAVSFGYLSLLSFTRGARATGSQETRGADDGPHCAHPR